MNDHEQRARVPKNHADFPWHPEHWFGSLDPRPFALFRICIGLVMVEELLLRLADFKAFLTDDGILPRALNTLPAAWSVFNWVGGPAAVGVVYGVGCVAALAFLLGFQTRVATVLCWILFVSLQNREREIALGGDYLLSILLFWSMFADLGARYSLDALRHGPKARANAFGYRLLAYTPALVYLHAARFKILLGAEAWLHGPAIYQTMHLDGWVRPPALWLRQFPELCALLGDGVLMMEILIPFCLVVPIAVPAFRGVGIALNLAVQIGILFTMKVGIFTDLMIAISLLYLQPQWLDALALRWQQHPAAKLLRAPDERDGREADARGPTQLAAWHKLALAAVMFVFVVHAALPAVARRIPATFLQAFHYLNLELKVDLYSHGYPVDRWESEGVLSNGARVDVLAVAAPGVKNGVAWRFSRWTALVGNTGVSLPPLAQHLCRVYTARSQGPALYELKLLRVWVPPHEPGTPPDEPRREVMFQARCPGAPEPTTPESLTRSAPPAWLPRAETGGAAAVQHARE